MKPRLVAATLLSLSVFAYAMPIDEMPPNTIKLSAMMQQLSAQPGFTEAFLAQIQGAGKKKAGAALLTPRLVDHMRQIILGKDWQKLDRFPGWTMAEINPTVRVIGHVVGKDGKVDETATAGGAPSGTPATKVVSISESTDAYLDVGPYSLKDDEVVDLAKPSRLPGFDTRDYVSSLGAGATRGDGPSPIAPEHSDSQRLADLLNRLSANKLDGAAKLQFATLRFAMLLRGMKFDDHVPPHPAGWEDKLIMAYSAPEDLIRNLQDTGHTITITDSRYFANFGHLHLNSEDVMMPFWINSQIMVPTSVGEPPRPLLVPVSHAEYEWHIRGPLLNADVSFYFGIDGKAEFRTMDQLDQAWVMKRDAHTYTGADAVEVTRLSGLLIQAYEHLHAAHPAIPFGGYYAFGVCQDVVAAIELKMTGKTTLFPNTADARFFTDPRDPEVNDLIKRIPKDRDGKPPEVERIFGSLPVGSSDAELATVSIPGLGPDLVAVHDAWTNGTLERVGERRRTNHWLYAIGALLTLATLYTLRRTISRKR